MVKIRCVCVCVWDVILLDRRNMWDTFVFAVVACTLWSMESEVKSVEGGVKRAQ